MKMTDQKEPIKFKRNLGRQHSSPTGDLDGILEEIERERAEQHQSRLDRLDRFIRLHGDVKWGANPNADRCLNTALKRETEDVWLDFISILGCYDGGDLQECKNAARYTNHGEFPWQVALRKIEPCWRSIINTLKHLQMWKVGEAILEVFNVPYEDDVEKNDCSNPNSESESGIATSMSSLANGKEPEENDDHHTSELSISPKEEDAWANLGFACAPLQNAHARQTFVSIPDLRNSPPSYSTEPPDQQARYSPIGVERGAKTLGYPITSECSLSPPAGSKIANYINNIVAGVPSSDEVRLWKLPHAQQSVGTAASNSIFYSEEVEAPNAARPLTNPFGQGSTNASVTGTAPLINSVITPPQTPMMYPHPSFTGMPSNSIVYVMQAPFMPMPPNPSCYPQYQAMPTNPAAFGIPFNGYPNGHVSPGPPTSIAPSIQPQYIVSNANNTRLSSASSAAAQQSLPNGLPAFPPTSSADVQATAHPSVNRITNPFSPEFNVRSTPCNDNWMSLPVNNPSQGSNQIFATTPPAQPSENTTPNVVGGSGSVSLPILNRNDMAVFLTYSADAKQEARILKQKLRQKFPGIHIITHEILSGTENFTTPEKIHRIFGKMDYIIPIISPQYLEDVKVEVAASNPDAGAIRALHVKYLDDFHHNGCKNLKVRALRLLSVTYEQVKTLPTCLCTARVDMDQLVNILYHSRTRAPGLTMS